MFSCIVNGIAKENVRNSLSQEHVVDWHCFKYSFKNIDKKYKITMINNSVDKALVECNRFRQEVVYCVWKE